jgi:hypothetical protein
VTGYSFGLFRSRVGRGTPRGDGRSFLFVFNHPDQSATIRTCGLDVRENVPVDGSMTIAAGGYAVTCER